MSLTVTNAYRYRVDKQRLVHRSVMSNCEKVTRRLVDDAVAALSPRLDPSSPETWIATLSDLMTPAMPDEFRTSRCEMYLRHSAANPDLIIRAYLYDYRAWTSVRPGAWPFYDTLNTWSYAWDDQGYGYLMLFLASGVQPSELTEGLHWVLDPFNCYGVTGETDNPTLTYEEVHRTWETVLDGSAPSYAGATASLEGFELYRAFGLT